MTEWITVDVNDVNKEAVKTLNGVNVRMMFSPYDVPRLFRGYKCPDNSEIFVIEFKYLTDEPLLSRKSSPDAPIELEVGVNSKRIYKIQLDMKKLDCQAVRLEAIQLAENVVGEIEKFRDSLPEKFRDRYKMPENLVLENSGELFSAA
jgi:hypothetical protein